MAESSGGCRRADGGRRDTVAGNDATHARWEIRAKLSPSLMGMHVHYLSNEPINTSQKFGSVRIWDNGVRWDQINTEPGSTTGACWTGWWPTQRRPAPRRSCTCWVYTAVGREVPHRRLRVLLRSRNCVGTGQPRGLAHLGAGSRRALQGSDYGLSALERSESEGVLLRRGRGFTAGDGGSDLGCARCAQRGGSAGHLDHGFQHRHPDQELRQPELVRRLHGRIARTGGPSGQHRRAPLPWLKQGPGNGTLKQRERGLGLAKQVIANNGFAKLPIWDTEMNYGNQRPSNPWPKVGTARTKGSAYLAQTYLYSLSNGVTQVYWYGWDDYGLGIWPTSKSGRVLKPG